MLPTSLSFAVRLVRTDFMPAIACALVLSCAVPVLLPSADTAHAAPAAGTDEPAADAPAADVEAMQQELKQLRREVKLLQGRVAGDEAIDADNRELRYELMRLRTERDRLRQEADEVRSLRYRARWGGLLFISGLALGYVVAVRRARRRMDREMGRI